MQDGKIKKVKLRDKRSELKGNGIEEEMRE